MFRCKLESLKPSQPGLQRSLRWLVVGLLVFAQVSLAAHYHEDHELATHECAVCSQLLSVEHNAAGEAAQPLLSTRPGGFYSGNHAELRPAGDYLLPPCRAPPLS